MANVTIAPFSMDTDWYPTAQGPCYLFNTFGAWLCVVILASVVLNGYIIYLFVYHEDLRSVSNGFVLSISSCDLLLTVFGMPLPMIANSLCRWPFGKIGCYYEAFVTYFVSSASMYILTLFSIDRYISINVPHKHKIITPKVQIIGIACCYASGFVLSALPILGWSSYTIEGAGTSCSIKWQDRSFNVVSYNVFIFAVLFILPVGIMAFCNYKVYMKIRGVARRGFINVNHPRNRRKLQLEKKILKTSFYMIVGFVFTWSPYTVMTFISAFGNPDWVSPIGATLPALIAKSQVVWNPLIYAVTNKNFQRKFPFLKVPPSEDIQMGAVNNFEN